LPLRKVKGTAKANIGIYEYYLNSDDNKKTEAYYYSYTGADGKSTKVKANSKDLNEVRVERASRIAQVKAEKPMEHKAVDQVLDVFVDDYIESREKKANAVKDRQKYFNHISPLMGHKLMSEVSINDVKKLRAKLQEKNLSDATIANILIVLKAMFNHADALDMKTQRPFLKKDANQKSIIKVKKKRSEKMKILSDKELDELFSLAKKKDKRLFFMLKMLFYTAQRPDSILSLKVNDINLEGNQIALEKIKGQSERYIPISAKLKPFIVEWIEQEGKETTDKLVGLSYSRMSALAQEVFAPLNEKYYKKKSMKKADLVEARHKAFREHRSDWASMYSLRHTAATKILSNTGNIKLAKEILGHSDLAMTEIYAKISTEQMQGGVDAI